MGTCSEGVGQCGQQRGLAFVRSCVFVHSWVCHQCAIFHMILWVPARRHPRSDAGGCWDLEQGESDVTAVVILQLGLPFLLYRLHAILRCQNCSSVPWPLRPVARASSPGRNPRSSTRICAGAACHSQSSDRLCSPRHAAAESISPFCFPFCVAGRKCISTIKARPAQGAETEQKKEVTAFREVKALVRCASHCVYCFERPWCLASSSCFPPLMLASVRQSRAAAVVSKHFENR